MTDKIVTPGEQIQPQVDLRGAVELAERLYGISVDNIKELDGYDDKNFYLKVSEPPNNNYMRLLPQGYVLKIMNSSDSKKLDYVEAQCAMMLHLDEHGIVTPQPQRNIEGKLYCLEQLIHRGNKSAVTSKAHVIRLLSFKEGALMKDVPGSPELYFEVGKMAAKIDLTLKTFSHPAYKNYSSLWMLKNVSHIKNFLFAVNDDNKVSLVTRVVEEFEKTVLSNFHSLESGMIHGDIHDQNLVCENSESGRWSILAVLDLGDAHLSAYVLELALAVAYMMLHSGNVQTGHYVIAGYCAEHRLPPHELKLLKVSVCARLCQSLVLGLYTHAQNPENTYVLSTQDAGWALLHTVWHMDSTRLQQLWLSP